MPHKPAAGHLCPHNFFIVSMLTETTALIRLGIGLVLGFAIGAERAFHKHPVGARTYMLICIGSTLATLVSIYICQTNTNLLNGDPGRIAAQILTGIGFIGAGLILKTGSGVTGITTAASIFATAVIGMAVGVGMIKTAALVTLAVIAILWSVSLVGKKDKKDSSSEEDR